MILRDYLALDRTILANERTLLAYLRTFIGTFSAGIAMINFLDTHLTIVTGYIFIAVSPLFVVFGIVRYIYVSKKLKTIDDTACNENTQIK
jgi:putative membrane protein